MEYKTIDELMKTNEGATLEHMDGGIFTPKFEDTDECWYGIWDTGKGGSVRGWVHKWKLHEPKPKLVSYYWGYIKLPSTGMYYSTSLFPSMEKLKEYYSGRTVCNITAEKLPE